MNDTLFPVVVQALAGEGYTVYAYMLDGTIHKVDVGNLVESGGVFEKLRDPEFFRNALTVMNDTVAWDLSGCHDSTNCIDIDPFTVSESEIVTDPLLVA